MYQECHIFKLTRNFEDIDKFYSDSKQDFWIDANSVRMQNYIEVLYRFRVSKSLPKR